MKKILLFLIKCILALLPVIAICMYILLCPFGYMDEEYPSFAYSKMVADGKIETKDETVLILGDSRAMAAIAPKEMGDNVYNLSCGGVTAIEMYYTLEQYILNNGVPKEVYIMFSPFHYSYMDNYKTRTLYFRYLDIKDAFALKNLGESFEAESLNEADRWDIIGMYLGLPSEYLPALTNSRFFNRYSANKESFNNLVEERGHGLFGKSEGCDELNYETNYEEMKMDGEYRVLYLYFDKLLSLLEDNGVKTVVLQAPMNRASFDCLHESYVEEYSHFIEQMSLKHKGIMFEKDIFAMDNRYFGDASHLNKKGALEYTKSLVEKYNGN